MNSAENRYERHLYRLEDFNLTPNGPARATDFMTVESAIAMLKMIFGESIDPNNPEILSFPHNWGSDNQDVLSQWIDLDLLDDGHRSELMMRNDIPANFGDQLDNIEVPDDASS